MNIDSTETSSKNPFVQNWLRFERNEIFLLLSYFFYGIAFSHFEAYAPVWLQALFVNESNLLIGLVTVIPSFVGLIAATIWGIAADRFGTKKFVLLGIAGFALMFLILIFSTSIVYFLVVLLIGFLFGTAHSVNVYALATRSIDKPKEITLAKLTITVSLSYVIFSQLPAFISDNFTYAKTIQLIIAVVAMCIAFLFAIFIKEKRVTEDIEENKIEITGQKKKVVLTTLPFLFAGFMVLIFMFQASAGFWAYSSNYFTETLEVEWKFYAILLMVKTALAIPLSFLLSRIKSTKRNSWIAIIFIAWICFSYLMMMLFPENWIFLFVLYSVPMYPLYNIAFFSLVTSITSEKKRATAYGILNSLGTFGYISGILLLGFFADISVKGIEIMFLVSLIFACVTLIIAILMFVIRTKKEIIMPIKEKEEGIEVQS